MTVPDVGVCLSAPGGTEQGSLLIEIASYVNELTRPIRHKAAYDVYNTTSHRREPRNYHTVQPSLLDQLRRGLEPAGSDDGGSIGGSYESRPPLNADALDCLMRVEAWSARWVSVALRLPLRTTVEDNLRALVGAAGGLGDEQLRNLVSDVRWWHTMARTVTDWQAPPWRPHAACPVCEKRGGLRVRLDTQSAVCVACGAHWTEGTIGILADHVRISGEDGRVAV